METIAESFLELLRRELTTVVENAVANALKTAFKERNYPERVDVRIASEITGYTRNTLYQKHSKGEIPGAIKIGGKLLFQTRDLQEWVLQGGPNHSLL